MSEKTYSEQQLQVTEETVKKIAEMPKETRKITVMVTNAYMEGLIAGQMIKEETAAS